MWKVSHQHDIFPGLVETFGPRLHRIIRRQSGGDLNAFRWRNHFCKQFRRLLRPQLAAVENCCRLNATCLRGGRHPFHLFASLVCQGPTGIVPLRAGFSMSNEIESHPNCPSLSSFPSASQSSGDSLKSTACVIRSRGDLVRSTFPMSSLAFFTETR